METIQLQRQVHRCPKCFRMWVLERGAEMHEATVNVQCPICDYTYDVRPSRPVYMGPDASSWLWMFAPVILFGVFILAMTVQEAL